MSHQVANHEPEIGFVAGLKRAKLALVSVAVMSSLVNVLYLTGSFFMLEVYDRVLPSRNLATLVGLSLIAGLLFLFQGFLDFLRLRIMTRIAIWVDRALHKRVHALVVTAPLRAPAQSDGLLPLRDLDQVRTFLASAGPFAIFDLPWMPFYLAICYAFHPLIGLAAFGGAIVLIAMTVVTDVMMRRPARAAAMLGGARNAFIEAGRRNAEVVRAMGMGERLGARWSEMNASYLESQRRAADVSSGFGAFSKVLRMMLQSGVLAIGAYLVINQQATAGIIIASSILTSRALAPVELALAHWKSFVAARQSWRRLSALLQAIPAEPERMRLPVPSQCLHVQSVSVAPPGVQRVVVHDAAFAMKAGGAVGVIGPSGSGKSSLARALVGVWRPVRGKVCLDGASLTQWRSDDIGDHIGYLPQEVELFAGTVAENISRFAAEIDPDAVIKAARLADVHDLVLRLPDGYETRLDEGGASLSVGQRQRIALARALYRDPFLVVLDEPNSNLDAEGENALTNAIAGLRERGAIVVVVAHRPSAIAACDHVLMMAGGRIQAFGPKDEVLNKVLQHPSSRPPASAPAPAGQPGGLKIVQDAEA